MIPCTSNKSINSKVFNCFTSSGGKHPIENEKMLKRSVYECNLRTSKCEIFELLDFHDFGTIKPLWVLGTEMEN
jgi:hypothetical protein